MTPGWLKGTKGVLLVVAASAVVAVVILAMVLQGTSKPTQASREYQPKAGDYLVWTVGWYPSETNTDAWNFSLLELFTNSMSKDKITYLGTNGTNLTFSTTHCSIERITYDQLEGVRNGTITDLWWPESYSERPDDGSKWWAPVPYYDQSDPNNTYEKLANQNIATRWGDRNCAHFQVDIHYKQIYDDFEVWQNSTMEWWTFHGILVKLLRYNEDGVVSQIRFLTETNVLELTGS